MAGKGRKARGPDLANRVRDAFNKALDRMASSPGGVIELSEIFEEMLTQDPLKTLDTISKFVPKEMMIEQTDPDEKGVFLAEALSETEWHEQHGRGSTH